MAICLMQTENPLIGGMSVFECIAEADQFLPGGIL